MLIRHVVARDNVGLNGWVIDARRARHGIVVAGKLADLAGEIDARTHLNRDFPNHVLDHCVVAERLELGAAVVTGPDGLVLAGVRAAQHEHLGAVDVDQRRAAWLDRLRSRRLA